MKRDGTSQRRYLLAVGTACVAGTARCVGDDGERVDCDGGGRVRSSGSVQSSPVVVTETVHLGDVDGFVDRGEVSG